MYLHLLLQFNLLLFALVILHDLQTLLLHKTSFLNVELLLRLQHPSQHALLSACHNLSMNRYPLVAIWYYIIHTN